jgi:hypothetical protein
MASLNWFRVESSIGTHPKVLALLSRSNGAKAFVAYIGALGHSTAHGTDGRISRAALPMVHGTPSVAAALVAVGLWEVDESGGGWIIHDFLEYQPAARPGASFDRKKALSRLGNCRRWHAPDCTCAQDPPSLEVVK